MSTRKFVLDGKVPRQEHDLITWAKWFENADRRVAFNPQSPPGGGLSGEVLTFFTSLEGVFTEQDPPLLFETIVMGGPWGGWSHRVETWEQAEAQHNKVVAAICKGLPSGEFP